MEPKHFNLLAIAAVVLLVGAGLVHGAYNDWSTEKVSGQKLLASFDADANKSSAITIQKAGTTLTIKRDGSGWVVADRSGYPANPEKVKQLIVDLTAAELVEPKTRVPERYSILELGDPAKKDAKSTLVKVSDKAGKALAEVVIGKRSIAAFGRGKAGTYVRIPGNPQTWLANVDIRTSPDVTDWVDAVFFRIDPSKVASLTVTEPGAEPYTLVADDKKKGQFKFKSVPADHKLKSGASATNMVQGVKTLEMTDVRKLDKLPEGEKVAKAVLVMDDGLKIEFRVDRSDDTDRWVAMKVIEAGKDKAAAKKISDRTDGWAFKVADWRVRQTFKAPTELFEAEKKPKLEPTPSAPEAPKAQTPAGPEPAAGPGGAAKP